MDITTNENNEMKPPMTSSPTTKPKKRLRASLKLIRAVLFLSRHSKSSKKAIVPVVQAEASTMPSTKDSFWSVFLCSMRPMHHQYKLEQKLEEVPPSPASSTVESFKDAYSAPTSPSYSTSSTGDDDGISRYASANDLQILNESDGNGDINDDIDLKAEEFIRLFYEQMKLQQCFGSVDLSDNVVIQQGEKL